MPTVKSLILVAALLAVVVGIALTGTPPKSKDEALARGGALTVGWNNFHDRSQ